MCITVMHYTATVEQLRETSQDLFDALERGLVHIDAPTKYALSDAASAHRDLEARKTTGSLVLIP